MSDPAFDALLDRRVRTYADGGVRPIDRHAIAKAAIESAGGRRGVAWLPSSWPSLTMPRVAPSYLLVLMALLLVAVAGAAFAGAVLDNRIPAPIPTATPTVTPMLTGSPSPASTADLTPRATPPIASALGSIFTYVPPPEGSVRWVSPGDGQFGFEDPGGLAAE